MNFKKITITGTIAAAVIIASVITVFATGKLPWMKTPQSGTLSNSSLPFQGETKSNASSHSSQSSNNNANVSSNSKTSSGINSDTKASQLRYTNTKYGFTYDLPTSWKGYKISYSIWEADSTSGNTKITGPYIYIRSPKWTSGDDYSLPIMIVTHNQWNLLENNSFTIEKTGVDQGIEPEMPMEYGRNPNYIFAVPERWWARIYDPTYYKEARNIVNSKPLHPIGQIPTPTKHY